MNRKLIMGLVGTAFLVFAALQMIPREYEASTTILVQPQLISPRFVQTSVGMDTGTRISLIHQQVMSEARLQRFIDVYDLYKPMKGRYTQAEIVKRMRDNVHLELIHSLPGSESNTVVAVRLTFRYTDPRMVAQVTNQLASAFIEDNLRIREMDAEGTAEFIDTRLELAYRNLEEQEELWRDAKTINRSPLFARDLETLRSNYSSLLQKKMDADMAADLEKRQKSERFSIIEPARIPEKPLNLFSHAGAW